MKGFARFIVNNKLWITLVFVLLLIGSVVGMFFVEVNYNDSSYLPKDSKVSRGLDAMYGEFGPGGNATVMLSDTTIEQATEFKAYMESIEGVASVIWIDDIFLSEEIGVIKNAQYDSSGEKVISDGKAVKFIMHMVDKLSSFTEDEMAVISSGDMMALATEILPKLLDGIDDAESGEFMQFMMGLAPALSMAGSGFDIGALDDFGPQLEMFYSDAGKMGKYALFQVSFTGSDYADSTMKAIDTIKATENVTVSIVGNSATTYNSIQMVGQETTISMIVAGIIVILILLLTTTSYLEPILLLLPIGAAILMNMGTNWLVPMVTGADGISYITQGVSSVLQLALTMDYCISILHRFKEEKKKGLQSNEAMVEALTASFNPISSASLTTVASFVALMFMNFKLGVDMGFVLMKGTVLSILCVFFLMPALILYTEKLIAKTEHKTFNLSFKKFSKGLVKSRFYVPFIIIALIIPCIFLQAQNSFTYGPEASLGGEQTDLAVDKDKLEKIFGKQNQVILLLPIEYYNNGVELDITYDLMEIEGVSQVQSMSVIDETGFGSMMPEKFKKQFLAKGDESNYSRVVIFLNADEEGDETTAIVNKLNEVADNYLAQYSDYGEGYVLGISSSTLEIKELVNADYDIITYVSIALVALIIALTFKSILIPIILVCVIQGSVYVNMAVPYITGLISGTEQPLVFIGYMLISSILLGATIDYAILLTDRYMEHRKTMNKYDAVRQALADSSRTLITSAGILVGAGAAVQFVSSLPATAVFGAAIFRGGILSFLFVMVLLPQLLILLDKAIMVTTWKGRKKMIDNKSVFLVAPEIEEASVMPYVPQPRQRRKKYKDMSSMEREDAILENILESIDNPEFDPYEEEGDEGEKEGWQNILFED